MYERGKPYSPGYKPHKDNPYKRSINQVGTELNFYAFTSKNGELDSETYENLLEQLEKSANEIFTKLRRQQMITREEKLLFSSYIALMLKRVSRYRERAEVEWPEVVDDFEASSLISAQINQIEENLDPNDIEKLTRIEKLREQYNQILTAYRQGMPKEILLGTIVRQGELARVLFNMTWQFFIAPDGMDYITSDNPVFFFEQFGLDKPYSELTFPISSNIALAATWNQNVKQGFIPATPWVVLEINLRTAKYNHNDCVGCTLPLAGGYYAPVDVTCGIKRGPRRP